QPRDEGAPHVAGSEYRDAPVGHGGVHCTGWIGRKRLRRFRRATPSVTANTPAKGVTFAGEKMALEGAFAGQPIDDGKYAGERRDPRRPKDGRPRLGRAGSEQRGSEA